MATQQTRRGFAFDTETNKNNYKSINYNQNAIVPGTGGAKAFPFFLSSISTETKIEWEKTVFGTIADSNYSNVTTSSLNADIKKGLMLPIPTDGAFGNSKIYFAPSAQKQYYNGTNTTGNTICDCNGGPGTFLLNLLPADNSEIVLYVETFNDTVKDSFVNCDIKIASTGIISPLQTALTSEKRLQLNNMISSGEYVILKVGSFKVYSGTSTGRSMINYTPVVIPEFDGYYVAEVDESGNYTNNLIEQQGKMYICVEPLALFNDFTRANTSVGAWAKTPWFGKTGGIFKEDEIFWLRSSSKNTAYLSCTVIKKSALTLFLNYLGIPWTYNQTKATSESIDNFDDGYNPNQQYYDPENPPGQPDNESGGGDGLGDNTQDNFEIPTPTINPARAAVNQYILNSNQVYSFLEELFNGTFWTNSDLLNKNPKESVVSLTAWPLNLLSWDVRHVGVSEEITCGNVVMEYADGLPIQNGYNKVIDIGEYEIKPYFGSFMDYLTKIEIFLPFIGWRNLSTQNVMGRILKVKYILNFEDGGVVVYITSTSTDGTIERLEQVEQAKLAFDLPIFTSNINEKEKDKLQLLMTAAVSAVTAGVGAFGSGAGGVAATAGTAAGKEVVSGASKIAAWQDHINGGSVVASNATWYLPNKCILKFTRPRKSEPSGYGRVNGYPANYTAKLGDVKGYTEVDNPVINGIECTEIERQKIKTLLQGGIYL